MSASTETTTGRVLSIALLATAIVVGAMTIRLLYQGRTHLAQGLAAISAQDYDLAVAELEDAAKAYIPFSPWVARAHEELSILAKTAQMRGDTPASLRAWEALRRSVLATRHVRVPNTDVLARADEEIAALRRDGGMSREEAAATVARPEDPAVLPVALMGLGILAWLLGAAGLAAGVGLADGLLLHGQKRIRTVAWVLCLVGLLLWLGFSAVA